MVLLQVLNNLCPYFQSVVIKGLIRNFSELVSRLIVAKKLAQDLWCYFLEGVLRYYPVDRGKVLSLQDIFLKVLYDMQPYLNDDLLTLEQEGCEHELLGLMIQGVKEESD